MTYSELQKQLGLAIRSERPTKSIENVFSVILGGLARDGQVDLGKFGTIRLLGFGPASALVGGSNNGNGGPPTMVATLEIPASEDVPAILDGRSLDEQSLNSLADDRGHDPFIDGVIFLFDVTTRSDARVVDLKQSPDGETTVVLEGAPPVEVLQKQADDTINVATGDVR